MATRSATAEARTAAAAAAAATSLCKKYEGKKKKKKRHISVPVKMAPSSVIGWLDFLINIWPFRYTNKKCLIA